MVYEFPAKLTVVFQITADSEVEAKAMLRTALGRLDSHPATVGYTNDITMVISAAQEHPLRTSPQDDGPQ